MTSVIVADDPRLIERFARRPPASVRLPDALRELSPRDRIQVAVRA